MASFVNKLTSNKQTRYVLKYLFSLCFNDIAMFNYQRPWIRTVTTGQIKNDSWRTRQFRFARFYWSVRMGAAYVQFPTAR